MSFLSIFVIVLWSLATAGVVWYLAEISTEVTYVTLADGRKTERSIPLLYRALLPFVGNFDSFVSRPAFARQVANADAMLVSAGFEGLMTGREFVALKLLVPIALAPVAAIVFFGLLPYALGTKGGGFALPYALLLAF